MFDVTATAESQGEKLAASANPCAIASALKEGRLYGKYMILNCSDKRRVIETTLSDCNFDPSAKPFAERTAAVQSGSFTLLSAALSSDGEKADVEAVFQNGFQKQAGIPLVVSLTVSLQIDGDCAAFVGGDNPLIKWLLGETAIANPKIAFGRSYSPLHTAPASSGEYLQIVSADVEITDSGAEFSAVTQEKVFDAVLFLDGTPALRALPAADSARIAIASATVPAHGTVTLGGDVIAVTDVTYNESPLSAYEVSFDDGGLGGAVQTDLRVGENSVFACDLTGNIAAVGGGEATLMRIVGGKVRVTGQRRITGEARMTRLTCDGCLFCMKGTELTRIDGRGDESKIVLPFEADDYAIVSLPSGNYLAAVLCKNRVYLTETDGKSGFGVIADIYAGGAALVGRIDSKRLIVGGKSMGAEVFGDGNSGSKLTALESVKAALSRAPQKIYVCGRLLYQSTASGIVVAADAFTQKAADVGEGGFVNGEQAFVCGNTVIYVKSSGGLAFKEISDAEQIVSVCRTNDGILRLKRGGEIDYMPFSGGTVTLTSEAFLFRGRLTVEYLTPSLSSDSAAKVTLGVQYG